jgi:ABC-type branched-subunit amino acid transport system ATPase component
MIALQAEDLHTFYGKSHILHGVSLEVREGEIVALLGRNGAGKTTTLRSLIGLNRPRTGKVALFGADVTGFPPYRIAGSGVGPARGRSPVFTRRFRVSPTAAATRAPSSRAASRRCCRSRAPCS